MSEATRDEELVRGYSGRVLLVVATASTASFFGQLVVSPLLPAIIDDLGISPARAGVALTVMWALMALLRYPGGRFADRLSRKTALAGSFAATTVGLLALAGATTYPLFLLGAAAVGVGGGLYVPAAVALLSETFVARRGRAFAVNEIAINLGGVAAGAIAAAALAVDAWHAAFLPAVGVLALVSLLSHRWIDEPYVLEPVDLDVRATGARLVGDRGVLVTLAAFALFAFTWQGFANFLPTYLQAEKGLAPGLASNVFTGLFVVGIAANLLVTPLGDRLGHARTAVAAAALTAVGLAAVILAPPVLPTLAGVVVFGLGNAAFWPLMTAHFMGVLPDGSMGGDYGAVSTVFMLIGSAGSTYVGVVAERASYALAFAGLDACVLAGAGLTLWIARRADRPSTPERPQEDVQSSR